MKKRNSSTKRTADQILGKETTLPSGKVAFLWDESFLWGVMAFKALNQAGLDFELIRTCDITEEALSRYALLFVPGGWASNKLKALGNKGIYAIEKFVREGGHYLGFCGGAGLATQDGIGLLDIKRRPTKERVPSFSGRILLNTSDHELWKGIGEPVFHAWWPSQFVIGGGDLKVLATYGRALPDAFSSDLNAGDICAYGDWADMEKQYGINLDPGRLRDEPAVVEGRHGRGTVILSLVHFDTPGDANGVMVLRNLWEYLVHLKPGPFVDCRAPEDRKGDPDIAPVVMEVRKAAADLIDLGTRNFLWFWRNPLLLQWRRGVRGLEYCTLFVLTNEIASLSSGITFDRQREKMLLHIRESLVAFAEKAKELLVLERTAMTDRHITYESCDIPQIQSLRKELFSTSKSHGGLFKEIISEMDNFLYSLLQKHNYRAY